MQEVLEQMRLVNNLLQWGIRNAYPIRIGREAVISKLIALPYEEIGKHRELRWYQES